MPGPRILRRGLFAFAACLLFAALQTARADAPDPKAFVGTFIGVADAVDIETGRVEQRDLTVEIKPYSGGGFLISWETVFKVDGRRDVPGVKRRFSRLIFKPADDGDFFVEVPKADPFKKRDEFEPILGDPARWATIEGNVMHVYSVVVGESGDFELEIYTRTRTESGLDIDFQRLADGVVIRRVTGRTVTAD